MTKYTTKIMGKRYLVALILLSLQILPLFYIIGLPLPKIISGLIVAGYTICLGVIHWQTTGKWKINTSLVPVVIFQSLMLISCILFASRLETISESYLYTAFVLSVQAIIPVSFYYLATLLSRNEIMKATIRIQVLYILFGSLVCIILFILSGTFAPNDELRNAPLVLSGYGNDTVESQGINLINLYIYFGRSNTIAPTIALSVVPSISYIFASNKKPIILYLLNLVMVGVASVILVALNSRASIIALISIILVLIVYKFLSPSSSRSKLNIIFLALFAIAITGCLGINERFTLESYMSDGRFEILRSLINSGKLNTFFGRGIASAQYLCEVAPITYVNNYGTNFCTFHNAFLTALHDLGILGLIMFTYLILRPSLGAIHRLVRTYSDDFKNNNIENKKLGKAMSYENVYGLALSSSALILLFFDSDIVFVHPIFSTMLWFYLGCYTKLVTT